MYSLGIAYLLFFLFGWSGAHRFYLGKTRSGFLFMFTGGLFGFGLIHDFFSLPHMVREANILKAIYNRNDPNFDEYGRWRYLNDNKTSIKQEKDSLERIILREAKENKGIITPSGIALVGNISIDDAKKYLDALVSKGFAELRVRKSGGIVYTIPDIMESDEPLENM